MAKPGEKERGKPPEEEEGAQGGRGRGARRGGRGKVTAGVSEGPIVKALSAR